MAKRKRKKKGGKPGPVESTVLVAVAIFAVVSQRTGSSDLALLAVAVGMVVYAWGKWRINRLHDRWRNWKRRRREQIDATPAIVAAGVAAVAAAGLLASRYLVWVIAGGVVAAAVMVAMVTRRRGDQRRGHPRARFGGGRQRASTSYVSGASGKPVYFMWQPLDVPDQPWAWKIGTSKNPGSTRKAFDRGNPLPVHLVGHVPGGYERETQLHQVLAEHRIPPAEGNDSREWFYDHPDVRAVIDDLCFEAGVTNPFPRERAA